MKDYRIYFLNAQGRITRALELSCAGDAEAMEEAAVHADGYDIELWERARLVGRIAKTESSPK